MECFALASDAFATTGANGQATVTYTSSATPGTCTVNVQEAQTASTTTTTVTQTSTTNTVAVTANPQNIPANGTSTSTVSVTVTNPSGTPIGGDALTITYTPSVPGACGTGPTSGTTNANGQFTFTYVSSTTSGFCQIKVTEAAGGQSGTTNIDQTTP